MGTSHLEVWRLLVKMILTCTSFLVCNKLKHDKSLKQEESISYYYYGEEKGQGDQGNKLDFGIALIGVFISLDLTQMRTQKYNQKCSQLLSKLYSV